MTFPIIKYVHVHLDNFAPSSFTPQHGEFLSAINQMSDDGSQKVCSVSLERKGVWAEISSHDGCMSAWPASLTPTAAACSNTAASILQLGAEWKARDGRVASDHHLEWV